MRPRSSPSSYPTPRPCKSLALLALLATGAVADENLLRVESGPGRVGPVSWGELVLELEPPSTDRSSGRWRLRSDSVSLVGRSGRLALECAEGGLRRGRPWCRDGSFEWHGESDDTAVTGQLFEPAGRPGLGLAIQDGRLAALVRWSADGSAPQARLRLDALDAADLPAALTAPAGLSAIEGKVSGHVDLDGQRLDLDLQVADGAFDRADGLVAGAGLELGLRGHATFAERGAVVPLELVLEQRAGELLVGPVYLPPPQAPLRVEARARFRPGEGLSVDAFTLDDGDVLKVSGRLLADRTSRGWRVDELAVERAELSLPQAWTRWGDGPASGWGFGDLATSGRIRGTLDWREGVIEALSVDFDEVAVSDGRGRFAVEALDGRFTREPGSVTGALNWQSLELLGLAFGASDLRLSGTPSDWRLVQPLRAPLLDGAVVIDELGVGFGDDADNPRGIELDARIEPLSLGDLTTMLGLPAFGGELSGKFPGVRASGDEIAFTGGIDIQAFSGRIGLTDLVIERPFGSLPALAAEVELERLDLAELTGTFNFGHMEGLLSGWVRGLRLLDWRPVAMDARLYTLESAPSRRISQRAVENLSRLGGGAAALSAPLLQLFESFPYRRAGLACRLDRNICHLDGVAPHESGGFYIVQGRGLPRLDVVGHRRLIDWPRLVAQLMATTQG